MKTLTARTNEFQVIKELAHSGRLVRLRVVWSWKHWCWMWEFKYVPFLEAMGPLLDKLQTNWLRLQSQIANDHRKYIYPDKPLNWQELANSNRANQSKRLGDRPEDLQNINRF